MSYPIFRQYDLPQQDTENIITIKVSTDTLAGGYCVQANSIAGTYLDGYGACYTPAKASAVSVSDIAIIDSSAAYYHDASGNRLSIDDPTTKAFVTGDRVAAIRPRLNKHYFLSNDAISGGTATAGHYLIPTASSYLWTDTTDITTDSPKFAFLVEEINVKDTFVGLAAVTGVRVRCVRALGV